MTACSTRFLSVAARIGMLVVAVGIAGCVNIEARRDLADVLSRFERQAAVDAGAYSERTDRSNRGIEAAPGGQAPEPAPATAPQLSMPAARPAPSDESLRGYLLAALESNPDILAAHASMVAAFERVPQVTAPPDPMLMTRTMPAPVRTADGDSPFLLSVTQMLPLPEKLDRAGQVALREAHMAVAELERVRRAVIGQVKRIYFRLHVIDKTTEIEHASREILRGLVDAARAQVAAGRAPQDDVLRAQVELTELEASLIELRQQRKSAAAALNRLLNRPADVPVPPTVELDVKRVDATLEALVRVAAERNPDLARLARQIERDDEAIRLARLAYVPDFTIGFEWMYMKGRRAMRPMRDPQTGMRPAFNRMSEQGMDAWGIMAGLNIPIWFERIEAGVREARSRKLASQHALTGARTRIESQILDALERVRAQQELAELLRDTILPLAQQAYEVSRASYASGKVDFLLLIENWRKWLALDIQYHRALGELEISVSDLEEAIGASLSEAEGAR